MKPPIPKTLLAGWPRSTLTRTRTARAGGRTLGALTATAMLLSFSTMAMADAAQAQTEGLAGTPTTTTGSWSCIGRGVGQQRSASATFQATGTATGPYPGPFTATGSASLHGNYGPLAEGYLGIGFTITSGSTTITGTITRNPLYGGVNCGGSIGFSTSSATYTATIQAGNTTQTISGAAAVAGGLHTQPGSQGSLNATLTLP
jgi:hypothetical protein